MFSFQAVNGFYCFNVAVPAAEAAATSAAPRSKSKNAIDTCNIVFLQQHQQQQKTIDNCHAT